jgi:opine dehydrogenase
MKITILGMGHAGTTIAADLTRKGHQVTLVKTSNALHNDHHKYLLKNKTVTINDKGHVEEIKLYKTTSIIKEGLTTYPDLIIIYIQTNYHQQLIKRLVPHLKGNEVFLFEPGYLATAYMLKYYPNNNFTIIEADSSPIDCRITTPGKVEVLFKNVRNPVGVFPSKNKDKAEKILEKIQYPFVFRKSVIESALHNPNLIVHTIGAIMSMPRIEYTQGEYWMYKEVFTPSVWELVKKLDREKMNVLEHLSFEPIPYVEACKLRNSEDLSIDAEKVFRTYAEYGSPKGPNQVKTRFITEDVPQGLVMLESLAKYLKIKTPVTSALIDLASAALNIPFRKQGRNIRRLGIENIKQILNDRY